MHSRRFFQCLPPSSHLANLQNALYHHHRCGAPVSCNHIHDLLQAYAKMKDLESCRRVHSLIVSIDTCSSSASPDVKKWSFHGDLIHAFASCGILFDANLVFADICKPSRCIWSEIISIHIMLEGYKTAFALYRDMLEEGFQATTSLFFSVLKACAIVRDLKQGRMMHDQFLASGVEIDVVSGTRFVDFYARCGALDEAQRVFDRMDDRSTVSWGALLAGYVEHERAHNALELYQEMQKKDVLPDETIFSSFLKTCGHIRSITHGHIIHDKVIKYIFEPNIVLGNSLIDMYAKCGCLPDARNVFKGLPNRSVISWASILAGYTNDGDGFVAFDLYMSMLREGIKPTKFIISSVLKACGQMCCLDRGKILHSYIVELELESDTVVSNSLIDMYIRCKSLRESYNLFNLFVNRDEVTWGSIISGFVQDDNCLIALQLFEKMQREGLRSNTIIFSCILQACGGIVALKEGMIIHNQIIIQGHESDSIVGSSLVAMYAKCGTLMEAIRVFDSSNNKPLTSWGALIDGCASLGTHNDLALELFGRMRVECVKPNIILYSSALKACLNVGTLEQCHALHTDIICNGLEIDAVAGNTLVNIYIKGGSVIGAQKVFDVMTEKDAITWNSLIYGYVENGGQNTHILKLYNDMIEAGMIPDRVTFLCVLKACDGIESSYHGRLLHASILLWDVGLDMSIGNALIDMYSRSGSIEDAKHVFTNMPSIDVVSFGTVIAGYAEHGNCDMVTHCLQIMRHQGTMPDARILSSVLTACSQTGQIQEAQHYLLSMREDPGINLTVEHFNLIADLIARAGHLSDAKHLLESLPTQVDAFGWMSLLSACGIYGNKDLAQRCFHQAVKLEPHCAAEYILLSNLLNAVASN